ncbi:hypothetical protein [Streptomyces sp. NPDC017086]|uniref:hypothetical protein n=1 Tax=Streptomyces sp. NPDC017086 TaxID=3364976 RepID=UPI00379A62AE
MTTREARKAEQGVRMTVWSTATPDSPAPTARSEHADDFLRALRGRGQAPGAARVPAPPDLGDDFDPRDPGTILSLALRTLRAQRAPASHRPAERPAS